MSHIIKYFEKEREGERRGEARVINVSNIQLLLMYSHNMSIRPTILFFASKTYFIIPILI